MRLIKDENSIYLMTYKDTLEAMENVPFGFCSNCGKSLNLEAEADVIECMCASLLHPNQNSSNMDDVEASLVKALEAHKMLVDGIKSTD